MIAAKTRVLFRKKESLQFQQSCQTPTNQMLAYKMAEKFSPTQPKAAGR